jgi:drug/metabolite transporter (DMT)-like permease
MNRPLVLLLITGLGLGLNFPLGKLATSAGVASALWAAYIGLAAGLSLLAITFASEARQQLPKGLWRFSAISGFVSFVMPNLITYTVIPKIGSGLAGMMFALSPMTTAILSFLLGVRPPSRGVFVGIGLGLLGAAIIIFGKDPNAAGGISWWQVLALAIPFFLGLGNVYRTQAWPKGASPRLLAGLTNLASVPFLLVIGFAMNGKVDVAPLLDVPWLMLAQLIVSTVMFLTFFRLQQIGGPTYLSQIGYVAAAVGLVIGVSYFGEVYPLAVWLGAGIIAVGIGISTLSQRRQNSAS